MGKILYYYRALRERKEKMVNNQARFGFRAGVCDHIAENGYDTFKGGRLTRPAKSPYIPLKENLVSCIDLRAY